MLKSKNIMKYLDPIIINDCKKIISKINLKKFKQKKVLILGANGNLASYLIYTLGLANDTINLNCQLTLISRNKPNKNLKRFIHKRKNFFFHKLDLNKINLKDKIKKKFHFIIHAASYASPAIFMKYKNETINLSTNVLKNILDKCKSQKSTLLFISSVDVYGNTGNNKKGISEEFNFENTLNLNRSMYGGSKRIGESLCKYYAKNYDCKIYIVRPANTYGPGLQLNDKRVVAEFIKKAKLDRKIHMLDSGEAIKTYGYIADICEMFLNIVQYGKYSVYNTTGQDNISIKDLAKTIALNYDNVEVSSPKIKSKLRHIGSDVSRVIISSKRYNQEFKKTDYVYLKEGIKNTIDWLRRN